MCLGRFRADLNGADKSPRPLAWGRAVTAAATSAHKETVCDRLGRATRGLVVFLPLLSKALTPALQVWDSLVATE